ncbi:GCN5-related N-acetyltransferase [Alkaliphilus metalliredigens QYMF]|uniref:GCN5-related N-acetyltransferase n=1 Tax=Alkaliphilus metalliredigens (strain QYMF) TaxID=293826 RepID=A6TX76_ALKMQ|nr:GNAT family N-acetyltransferase [Alkaliphilus metalliredigens]ABR50794.1 GCN5-related N-acetyltransferase [Alkaliphilus metalliredigens QYMF]
MANFSHGLIMILTHTSGLLSILLVLRFSDEFCHILKASHLNEGLILPEEEEKRGMTIYLAEKDQQIIGKVNLQLSTKIGGIYGLGVLPEYRGKGFGRAILMMAIEKLKEANAGEVMLQVAAENANALNFYKSCGFMETSIMDYYKIRS